MPAGTPPIRTVSVSSTATAGSGGRQVCRRLGGAGHAVDPLLGDFRAKGRGVEAVLVSDNSADGCRSQAATHVSGGRGAGGRAAGVDKVETADADLVPVVPSLEVDHVEYAGEHGDLYRIVVFWGVCFDGNSVTTISTFGIPDGMARGVLCASKRGRIEGNVVLFSGM